MDTAWEIPNTEDICIHVLTIIFDYTDNDDRAPPSITPQPRQDEEVASP